MVEMLVNAKTIGEKKQMKRDTQPPDQLQVTWKREENLGPGFRQRKRRKKSLLACDNQSVSFSASVNTEYVYW